MTVKLYGKTFEVSGKWVGYYVEETNEKPSFEVESIIYEGREILNLIYNKPLYFKIVEMVVTV